MHLYFSMRYIVVRVRLLNRHFVRQLFLIAASSRWHNTNTGKILDSHLTIEIFRGRYEYGSDLHSSPFCRVGAAQSARSRTCFLSWVCTTYTDPVRHRITAGYDLDDPLIDRDLSDLSDVWHNTEGRTPPFRTAGAWGVGFRPFAICK